MDRDLRIVLQSYPAQSRPWDEPTSLGNAGGLSGSTLWRYHSGRGLLVAKAWPINGPPPAQIERVHHWLNEAVDVGFVPVPLTTLHGRSYIESVGRHWEVVPWLPGEADPTRPPPLPRLRAGFVALATFHQILAKYQVVGPSPGVVLRLAELRGLLGGGLSTIVDAIGHHEGDPLQGPSFQWVKLVRESGPELIDVLSRASDIAIVRQPILRDARPEHFLFEGDRVSGLVDYGAMGVDTVAADLARLASEWIDPGEYRLRSEAFNAYESIRPLSAAERVVLEAIDRSTRMLGPGRWARWHFVEGRVFLDRNAVSRGLLRSLDRLNSARAGPSRMYP